MNLIYTVAVGKRYQNQTLMLHDTLRKEGGYKDHFLVFTDDDRWITDGMSAYVIRKDPDIHGTNLKVLAHRFIGGDYEYIMHLDSDILCFKPIEPMFGGIFRCDTEAFFSHYHNTVNDTTLNSEQRSAWKAGKWPVINTGEFCCHSSRYHDNMEALAKILEPHVGIFGAEQSALNRAVRFEGMQVDYWDYGFVDYAIGGKGAKDPILFHYNGRSGENFMNMLNAYEGLRS